TDGVHKGRLSALWLADRKGQIAYGDMSAGFLVQDNRRPYGVRMDGEKLFQVWKAAAPRAVVSIEWGDLSRLEELRKHMTTAVYEQWKAVVMQELDAFIGACLNSLHYNEGIWVVSSGPHHAPRKPGAM